MILITGGYPQSGKSEFSRRLSKAVEKWVVHLDPKEWLPDDYSSMSDRDRSIWMTSAWELACEKLTEYSQKAPNKALIIFDTAAAKSLLIEPMIRFARKNGHNILYAFVDASLKDRQKRTDEPGVLESLQSGYSLDFKHTIPVLKKASDKFVLIKNSNGEAGYRAMEEGIEQLAQYIKQIRE